MKIIVKIGSSSITHETGLLNLRKIERLASVLSDLNNAGHSVVLVSSGAIAAGKGKMNIKERAASVIDKQAMASIGQCELMHIYDCFFSQFSKVVAQMLLTKRVISDATLRENAYNTLHKLLAYNVIPIINENDSVATDEIVYGDNDTLSAMSAALIKADLLILLSDVDGLYDKNPVIHEDAKFIQEVDCIDASIEAMASGSVSDVGTGGMTTKIQAAKIATEAGCDMIIANGADFTILYDIVDGKRIGTRFKGGN